MTKLELVLFWTLIAVVVWHGYRLDRVEDRIEKHCIAQVKAYGDRMFVWQDGSQEPMKFIVECK